MEPEQESPGLAYCKSIAIGLKEISKLATQEPADIEPDGYLACKKINEWTERMTQDLKLLQDHLNWFEKLAMKYRPPFRQPGIKVLKEIFFHLFPPNYLLDASLSPGYNSPWCQTLRAKKVVISVCRVWYDVGTEFLYRDVVIRRVGQIPALLETLQDPDAKCDFASYIQSLNVSCCVPRAYQQVFQSDMKEIVKLCCNLKHLHINIFGDTNDMGSEMPFFDWDIFPVNTPSLFFGHDSTFLASSPRLALCANHIQSLSFSKLCALNPDVHLEFPQLRVLEYRISGHGVTAETVQGLTASWKIPNLDTLILQTLELDVWLSFLAENGPKLRRLALPHLPRSSQIVHNPTEELTSAQSPFDYCTSLEHLVIPFRTHFDPSPCGATLKYLDFWVGDTAVNDKLDDPSDVLAFSAPRSLVYAWGRLPHDVLPQLRSIRLFHRSIGLYTNLPFHIAPSDEVKDFEFHYAGIRLVCESGNIFNTTSNWSYEWVPLEYYTDSEQDSDEEAEKLHVDDTMPIDEANADSEETNPEESSTSGLAAEFQLDHSAALQIFRDILMEFD
ncbi:hypothetical protein AX16_003973 [Volvariella volvacea WC 439]|nr:hypothetical protein AX16_003973 [Volvariella volvacea WC 439]